MTGKPGPAELERRSRRQGAVRLKEEYKRDRGLGVSGTGPDAGRDDDREKLVPGKGGKGGKVMEVEMMDQRVRGDGRKVGAVMPPGHGGR